MKSLNIPIAKFTTIILLLTIHLSCTAKPENPPYSVGFNYYKIHDSTRKYLYKQDTVFRPLLLHFWYPSKVKSPENKMNFQQYIDLISIREDFSKTTEAIDTESFNFLNAYAEFAKNNYGIGLNISIKEILDSPVEACMSIPRAKGKFPLIIYSPSNSKSPIQNHIICEMLASNGYYVISVASAGQKSIRREDPEQSILAQVEDMKFILDYFENNLKIKYSNIGLLNFSTGGLATSIFQMKHDKVEAVFSMDGSQEYSFYIYLSKLKDYDINKSEVPYFLVYNKNAPSIYPYFNSIKSNNKFFFRMPYISHFGFVSFWTYFDDCSSDTVKHNYSISYKFICEYALAFFNATLNNNKKSNKKLLSLISQENEFAISDGIEYSQATNLLNIYLQYNIDLAIYKYKKNKIEGYDNYVYNENEISFLGRMLLDYDVDASIKLFSYNIEEYSNSWHAYFDLGYSYKLKGDIDLAKKYLLNAQEKKPENKDIKELLEKLEE